MENFPIMSRLKLIRTIASLINCNGFNKVSPTRILRKFKMGSFSNGTIYCKDSIIGYVFYEAAIEKF